MGECSHMGAQTIKNKKQYLQDKGYQWGHTRHKNTKPLPVAPVYAHVPKSLYKGTSPACSLHGSTNVKRGLDKSQGGIRGLVIV